VEAISFIPSLLLVQLFRRTRQRISDQARLASIYQALQLPVGRRESIRRSKGKKSPTLTFPWWCIFVAYGLSLILIAISAFFIVVRGIEFGDLKTQKWLTSLVVGFFSSVCLTQPIKVGGALQYKGIS
jgi:drug/metabolite transporter (DMT)-like permease